MSARLKRYEIERSLIREINALPGVVNHVESLSPSAVKAWIARNAVEGGVSSAVLGALRSAAELMGSLFDESGQEVAERVDATFVEIDDIVKAIRAAGRGTS